MKEWAWGLTLGPRGRPHPRLQMPRRVVRQVVCRLGVESGCAGAVWAQFPLHYSTQSEFIVLLYSVHCVMITVPA